MKNDNTFMELVAYPLEYELKHRKYKGNTKNLKFGTKAGSC